MNHIHPFFTIMMEQTSVSFLQTDTPCILKFEQIVSLSQMKKRVVELLFIGTYWSSPVLSQHNLLPNDFLICGYIWHGRWILELDWKIFRWRTLDDTERYLIRGFYFFEKQISRFFRWLSNKKNELRAWKSDIDLAEPKLIVIRLIDIILLFHWNIFFKVTHLCTFKGQYTCSIIICKL